MTDLQKLKICFLAGTLGQGGAERQLFYVLEALKKAGSRVHLLCLTRGEFWEEPIRRLGVPITWVGQASSPAVRLYRIMREVRAVSPDVLQSQHTYTNIYVSIVGRLAGLREIGAIRGDPTKRDGSKIVNRYQLLAPRFIVANSMRAILKGTELGIHTDQSHFLPNVVDTSHFVPEKRPEGEETRLLTVSRLIQSKRLDKFIQLVARLREETSLRARATIVGSGPMRTSLENMAGSLNLTPDAVEFKGEVADPVGEYRKADIFVFFSEGEGMPNVVLEAGASGLPVVSSNVGGIPEMILEGETGFLLDSDDENGFFQATMRLILNEALRKQMGYRARHHIELNYGKDKLPGRLERLYGRVLE